MYKTERMQIYEHKHNVNRHKHFAKSKKTIVSGRSNKTFVDLGILIELLRAGEFCREETLKAISQHKKVSSQRLNNVGVYVYKRSELIEACSGTGVKGNKNK